MALHCAAEAAGTRLVPLPLETPHRFQVRVTPLTAVVLWLLVIGKSRRVTSVLRKKNSLSFLMGPPSVAPAWFRFSEATTAENGSCPSNAVLRSEEHTSELQSLRHLVCRLLLEKKP